MFTRIFTISDDGDDQKSFLYQKRDTDGDRMTFSFQSVIEGSATCEFFYALVN